MRKRLVLFFLVITHCSITALSQDAGERKRQESLKTYARNYFEKVYVPMHFKNPYSYKFSSIRLAPNTMESDLTDSLSWYENKIEKLDTMSYNSEYQRTVRLLKAELKEREDGLPNDSATLARHDNWLESLRSDYGELKTEYEKTAQRKASLANRLKNLTPADKKKIVNYTVFLRCYGRNSFGGIVYSAYYFSITPQKAIGLVNALD
ncbi:hypothetical protein EOD41_19365 [Mucilaginibacter limnophilus]|uniref:Uncharacterized protein n=1 Tax=Mucilaginibacter limnophilus TaxID=1932778 RepID=A0A437MHQ1_9SPHI|nr:hypothetical protein [Mucilaginibacter limnophilus]RVT97169.1 hypothetical protein EOD41_19365 [Mucilaginibacter limnophilus]